MTAKIRNILSLGKGTKGELDDTTLTAEKEYFISFTELNKKCCINLHFNGINSNVFVNGLEIHKFKAKDSEINAAPLCLGDVSKDFLVDNTKKTKFPGSIYDFSVDYDAIAVNDILDIHNP